MNKGARMQWFGYVIGMDEAAAPKRFLFAASWDHRAAVWQMTWQIMVLGTEKEGQRPWKMGQTMAKTKAYPGL